MEFKFNIDTTAMEKDIQAKMVDKMRMRCSSNVESFFDSVRTRIVDSKWEYESGDGLKQINEMIENKFLDPKFQESMDRFFDHNWEKIFEECMMRALQHKANGIAFNKVHALPLTKKVT